VSISLRRAIRGSVTGTAATLAVLFGASTAQAVDIPAITNDYVFSKTLSQFTQLRAQQPYSGRLDWSSDGCSYSPDNPFGFKFLPGCHRHDFGYRNFKKQGRFTEATRLQIDNKFKSDLYNICAGNWACNRTADLYYEAVRKFGGSGASTAAAVDAHTG
jgi:hypothetical protein